MSKQATKRKRKNVLGHNPFAGMDMTDLGLATTDVVSAPDEASDPPPAEALSESTAVETAHPKPTPAELDTKELDAVVLSDEVDSEIVAEADMAESLAASAEEMVADETEVETTDTLPMVAAQETSAVEEPVVETDNVIIPDMIGYSKWLTETEAEATTIAEDDTEVAQTEQPEIEASLEVETPIRAQTQPDVDVAAAEADFAVETTLDPEIADLAVETEIEVETEIDVGIEVEADVDATADQDFAPDFAEVLAFEAEEDFDEGPEVEDLPPSKAATAPLLQWPNGSMPLDSAADTDEVEREVEDADEDTTAASTFWSERDWLPETMPEEDEDVADEQAMEAPSTVMAEDILDPTATPSEMEMEDEESLPSLLAERAWLTDALPQDEEMPPVSDTSDAPTKLDQVLEEYQLSEDQFSNDEDLADNASDFFSEHDWSDDEDLAEIEAPTSNAARSIADILSDRTWLLDADATVDTSVDAALNTSIDEDSSEAEVAAADGQDNEADAYSGDEVADENSDRNTPGTGPLFPFESDQLQAELKKMQEEADTDTSLLADWLPDADEDDPDLEAQEESWFDGIAATTDQAPAEETPPRNNVLDTTLDHIKASKETTNNLGETAARLPDWLSGSEAEMFAEDTEADAEALDEDSSDYSADLEPDQTKPADTAVESDLLASRSWLRGADLETDLDDGPVPLTAQALLDKIVDNHRQTTPEGDQTLDVTADDDLTVSSQSATNAKVQSEVNVFGEAASLSETEDTPNLTAEEDTISIAEEESSAYGLEDDTAPAPSQNERVFEDHTYIETPSAEAPAASPTEDEILSEFLSERDVSELADEATAMVTDGPITQKDQGPMTDLSQMAYPDLNQLIVAIDTEIAQTYGIEAVVQVEDVAHSRTTGLDLIGLQSHSGSNGAEADGEAIELNLEQFILFTMDGIYYAVAATNVREIGELSNITAIPNIPNWLLGVTNLRGDIISLVDLPAFLKLKPSQFKVERQMMVVRSTRGLSPITTGLVVDNVYDIQYFDADLIKPPNITVEEQIAPFLRGVYQRDRRVVMVLDLERLLNSPEIRQFEPQ